MLGAALVPGLRESAGGLPVAQALRQCSWERLPSQLPPGWWYAQSAVELSWSDESRSSTRMCVLLVEGYLLQRTRDKRRAINMSPTWSRSRVVMSPGETPRDRYHPISHSPYTNRRSRKREVHVAYAWRLGGKGMSGISHLRP